MNQSESAGSNLNNTPKKNKKDNDLARSDKKRYKNEDNITDLDNKNIKIISLYNFKGGVGKTMISRNLSHIISKNSKVLLVDLDSQCNLTSLLNDDLKSIEDKIGEDQSTMNIDDVENDDTDYTDLEKLFTVEPLESVKTLWDKVELNQDYIRQDDMTLVDNVKNCVQLQIITQNLTFLRGTHKLSEIDNWINTRYTTLQDRFKFTEILIRLAHATNHNVIIIDLNPGESSLNKSVLFRSNHIICPTFLDHTSVSSTLIFLTEVYQNLFRFGLLEGRGYRFHENLTAIIINKFKSIKRKLIKIHKYWYSILFKNVQKLGHRRKVILLSPNFESKIMSKHDQLFCILKVPEEQWKIDWFKAKLTNLSIKMITGMFGREVEN